MRRNIIATLLLSQGTPMLLMGDEVGRTQNGNNNAYCQDNEINWLEWDDVDDRNRTFLAFVRRLIEIRNRYRVLRWRNFLHGRDVEGHGKRDVVWYRPDGVEMDGESWSDGRAKVVGLLLRHLRERLLVIVNAYHDAMAFKLPQGEPGETWSVVVDTATGEIDPPARTSREGTSIRIDARSLLLLSGRHE